MVRKVIAEVFFFFVAAVAVVAEVGKAFFHILALAERSFILIYTALMPVDRVPLVFPQQYKHPKHSNPTCIAGAIRDFSLLDFRGGVG